MSEDRLAECKKYLKELREGGIEDDRLAWLIGEVERLRDEIFELQGDQQHHRMAGVDRGLVMGIGYAAEIAARAIRNEGKAIMGGPDVGVEASGKNPTSDRSRGTGKLLVRNGRNLLADTALSPRSSPPPTDTEENDDE